MSNKYGYCEVAKSNHRNKYKVQIIGCQFSRYLDSKEDCLKIKQDYLDHGLDYVKEHYPKKSLKGIPHKFNPNSKRPPLTYEAVVAKLHNAYPDNMIGINKIIKVYKDSKIYTNPNTHHTEKYFFATIECSKCHKRRKVNVRNLLYSPKRKENSNAKLRSHSCICQNFTFFKKDYIGKIYGDFKILDIVDTKKNFASKKYKDQTYRLAIVECTNCHTQLTMTFNALAHPSKSKNCSHFCPNCHLEQATITNQIKSLQSIYKSNSSIDDLLNNKSYIKGVWFDKFKNKWCARISEKVIDPKSGPIPKTRHFFLGEFDNYDDAVAARMYAVEHKLEMLQSMLDNQKNED